MKLHAQLILDYGKYKTLEVFEGIIDVFQSQGFIRGQFCTLDNWKLLKKAMHFQIHGSIFSEISYSPIANHRLDLLMIKGDPGITVLERVLDKLVRRFSARQALLHSSDYYYWQNAEQPMEYECEGRDHSKLPKVHNGLPPPLGAIWIDISRNPGRSFLRNGFQEAVSSPMWLRLDQITNAQIDKIRYRPGFEVTTQEAHFLIRHACSPFDEQNREDQEFLRFTCFSGLEYGRSV